MRLGPPLVMTPDLDAALHFYGGVLGLCLSDRTENQLIFNLAGAALHVFRCDRAAPVHRHGSNAGSVITFEVESLDQAMTALRARGVVFLHERPARNEAGRLRYAAFQAPGGNVHELVERDRD